MKNVSPSPNLSFRLYEPQDYESVKRIMIECYADLGGAYATEEELNLLSHLYQRGQIVCLLDDKIIGGTTSRIVPYDVYSQPHSLATCANLDLYESDAMNGDSVYGLDVFVMPEYQNLRIAKQVVEILNKHIFEDNFRFYMGTSRLVNYAEYADKMSIKEYTAKVKNREIYDMALTFHLKNGVEFINENPNFCKEDIKSAGHGVIIGVPNPSFDPERAIYPERANIFELV